MCVCVHICVHLHIYIYTHIIGVHIFISILAGTGSCKKFRIRPDPDPQHCFQYRTYYLGTGNGSVRDGKTGEARSSSSMKQIVLKGYGVRKIILLLTK
jgi:hypothetical protein